MEQLAKDCFRKADRGLGQHPSIGPPWDLDLSAAASLSWVPPSISARNKACEEFGPIS